MARKYVGGDQNPLRQGFLRYLVMVRRYGGKNVVYLMQDADAIAGGQNKTWGLTVARTTYFPFSFDLWGHPEYPGSKIDASVQAKLRALFGVPRLIVVGPDSFLTVSGVSTENKELWATIIKGFERETHWAFGLRQTPETQERAAQILSVVKGHSGKLTALVTRLGGLIIPELRNLEVGAMTDFYSRNEALIPHEKCWVIREGQRESFSGVLPEGGILVPKGLSLIEDMSLRGYKFFGTHLPYITEGYTTVHFNVSLPLSWTFLTDSILNPGWQSWGQRPTLISAYILGGKNFIEACLDGARVEDL